MGTGHFITALSCLLVKLEGLLTGSNLFILRHWARVGGGKGGRVAVNMGIHRKFHAGTRAADTPAYTDIFHQEAASLCSCSRSMIASPSPYSATGRGNIHVLYV